jgi:hypothetical protein
MGVRHNAHAGSRVHCHSTSDVAKTNGQHGRQPRAGRALRIALVSALLALIACLGLASGASASPVYDMRGEWQYSLTCTCGQNATGTMLLKQMEFTSGAFSGTTKIDGILEGTASGTVTGTTSLSLDLVIPHAPPSGEEFTFTMTSGALESAKNEFSGTGSYGASAGDATGEIKAKRIRSQAQIEKEEQEAIQRAKEAKEKAEQEAKELAEKEAAEKPIKEKAEAELHEREAKEAQEAKEKQAAKEAQEAKEKQAAKEAQEAKEKQAAKEAQEAKEKQAAKEAQEAKEKQAKAVTTKTSVVGPAKPNTKTIAVSSSGVVSIELSNPDGYAISGVLTLSSTGATKSAVTAGKKAAVTAGKKAATLAESPFSIAAHATKLVKLKLSKSAAAELAGHKSLRVAIKLTTRATGRSSTTSTYSVTLQSPSRTKH